MALDLTSEYPGQVITGDPGYLYGKAQNVTVEGDGTGTPLEAAIYNDLFGFQQALLAAAGITPSGNPDMVGASDYLLALYRLGRWAPGWGAVGNGVADDTAPLQAAITAVAALGTGLQELHLWPGATYRHTGLSVPANVSIFFHGATLQIDHATNNGLTYAGTTGTDNGNLRQRLVGGRFSANVANTGAPLRVTGGAGLDVEQCYFGASTNCNGKLVDTTGSSSTLRFVGCTFHGRASSVLVEFGNGFLELVRCKYVVPAAYSTSCIKLGGATAWIEAPRFELTAHNSGTMVCIEVTSAAAVVHVTDAVYNQDTDPATTYAIKWTAAAKIIERGTSLSGNITPYDGSVVLAEGSSLDLRQHGEDTSTVESYPLPDDYRSFSLAAEFNTFPIALTMPTIRFIGQEYDLQLYNKSATDWATSLDIDAMGPPVATVSSPQEALNIRTGRFRVMRNDFGADYRWTLVGGWSEPYVRGVTIGN